MGATRRVKGVLDARPGLNTESEACLLPLTEFASVQLCYRNEVTWVFREVGKPGGNKTAFYHQQMLSRIVHEDKHVVRAMGLLVLLVYSKTAPVSFTKRLANLPWLRISIHADNHPTLSRIDWTVGTVFTVCWLTVGSPLLPL